MSRRIAPLAVLALLALPAAAHAGSTQYVGDPVTYLVQGQAATQLTTVFRVNQPLPSSGVTVAVATSGGPTLGSAAPRAFGTTGLCYQARVTLSTAVASGGTVELALSGAGLSFQPDPELVRLYSAKKVRVPANLIGGNC